MDKMDRVKAGAAPIHNPGIAAAQTDLEVLFFTIRNRIFSL
jgi:hypothetical protein